MPPVAARRNHWLVSPLFAMSVVAVIAINSLLLCVVQLATLPLYPLLSRRHFRRVIQFTQRAYTESLILVCYLFAPTKMVLTGDAVELLPRTESVVLIANHQAYVDWIYMWLLAHSCHAHGLVKIILKDSLKHIPVLGWGMRFFEFIFLRRNWLKDRRYLASMLDLISSNREAVWLLIFPEGTIYCDQTRERSSQFAAKAGITDTPKHVLLPRVTGLDFCLNHLRSDVDALYDITMGYGHTIHDTCDEQLRYDAMFMVASPAPVLHFHIRRFAISDIPIDPAEPELMPALPTSSAASILTASSSGSALSARPASIVTTAAPPTNSRASAGTTTSRTEDPSPPLTRSSTPGGEFLNTPFRQWLHRVYMEKDNLMDRFYADGHFPAGSREHERVVWVGDRRNGLIRALGDECALIKVWAGYGAITIAWLAWYLNLWRL